MDGRLMAQTPYSIKTRPISRAKEYFCHGSKSVRRIHGGKTKNKESWIPRYDELLRCQLYIEESVQKLD